MCGIVGYTGTRMAAPILAGGLRHLEYRGYDSYGIAVSSPDRDELAVTRKVGRLPAGADLSALGLGCAGIGHTRWATHGEVSEANAHPQLDCTGRIAVVHNGTIDNCVELRKQLEGRGHHFTSATDTEIIPHLLEEMPLSDVVELLEGTYAILVLRAGSDVIEATCDRSPLLVTWAEGGVVLSSSPLPGLAEVRTTPPRRLASGEITRLSPEVTFTDDWQPPQGHSMRSEIREQPAAILQTARLEDGLLNRAAIDLLPGGPVPAGTLDPAVGRGRQCLGVPLLR
jgi:glucosamine--fructose-6-phosphate aminotransferase (isomerizing)